ncbi:MAG TPA: carbohydrate ABC transporter permease [Anaerolinea sp.]|nr:carbohydrate ABC transporter permease [Anaerolinea sp.]
MVVPFYWSVSTSFKLEQFVFANPPQWWPEPLILQNYIAVFTKIHFYRYFLNSVFVAVITTLAHVFFDTLAAYAFAKLIFPGRDKLFFFLLLGLMVPFQVNLIPLYRIMASLGWTNTYLALIVPNLTSIFGIFMMRQFLLTIPNDLMDAGRIDGCDEFGVFWRVVIPLAVPGIATLIILTFMGVWNDFLWPRIVTSSEALYTLPVGLAQLQMKNTSNVAQIMAGTVLTALPMIVVFLFMQRQFISGMTAGALKE